MNNEIPFYEIFYGLADDSVKSLRGQFEDKNNQIALCDSAWDDIRKIICSHLSEVSIYLLWQEFNTVRPTQYFEKVISQMLEHPRRDPSGYPSAKYKEFVKQNDLLTGRGVWKNYPILTEKIIERNNFLKENIHQLLINAKSSLDKIQQALKIKSKCLLSRIVKQDSDSHWQGRGVYLLELCASDSFEKHQIIYKQRPVTAEQVFYNVVEKINEILPEELHLRTLWTIDEKTHGYMEFVEYGICKTAESEADFYNKCGVLLAILYCLGVTDCHFENIICDGVHPCLIDCETILEPAQSTHTELKNGYRPFTVTSTGFLNCLVTSNTDKQVNIDLSPININPNFEDDEKIRWLNLGSDLIAISTEPAPQTPKKCLPNNTCFKDRPRINNVRHIEKGFTAGYRSIKSTTLEIIGIIDLAKNLRSRSIFRPTYIYSAIIKNLLQPGILENTTKLDQLISPLDEASDAHSSCQAIVKAEKKQLLDFDIPYFRSNPYGEINQEDPIDISLNLLNNVSGYRSFLDRISAMSNLDMNFQLRLINASLLPDLTENNFLGDGSGQFTLSDYLADIMNHIWSTKSIDIFGKSTWVVFESESVPFESYPGGTGLSLYDGTLGICAVTARYISSLGKNNKLAEHYRNELDSLLPSTLDSIKRLIDKDLSVNQLQVGTSGLAGIYISLMSILSQLSSSRTNKQINSIVKLIENHIELYANSTASLDPPVDYLNGVAGMINCIASYPHRFTKTCHDNGLRILRLLIERQNTIVAKRILSNESTEELLKCINLSHGLGGMLLVFAKLLSQKHTHEPKYNSLYIRSSSLYAKAFDKILCESTDDSKAWKIPLQWCSGLSGILLVYAKNQQLFPQTSRPHTLNTAINIILNKLQSLDKGTDPLHLCCGLSGVAISASLCADYGLNVDTNLLQRSFEHLIPKIYKNKFDLMIPGISSSYQPALYTGMAGMVLAGIEINSSRDLSDKILC